MLNFQNFQINSFEDIFVGSCRRKLSSSVAQRPASGKAVVIHDLDGRTLLPSHYSILQYCLNAALLSPAKALYYFEAVFRVFAIVKIALDNLLMGEI